jgi:peptide-methionine (S)-S-oxide reductase
VGFVGGPSSAPSPTYDSVCDGDGHTEVVRVSFDPEVISYDEILAEFWDQSGSRATKARAKSQYKSAIWTTTRAHAEIAEASLARVASSLKALKDDDVSVVTEILPFAEDPTDPATGWHDAPERHQRYVAKHREAKLRRAAEAAAWVDDWTERGVAE